MNKQSLLMKTGILLGIVLLILNLPTSQFASAQDDPAIISDLDWSPDGSHIAIGISTYGTNSMCTLTLGSDINFLDISSQQIKSIPRTDTRCSVTNVDYSPNGLQLLITSDSRIEIWDLSTKQRLSGLLMESIFEHAFWSPDGSIILDMIAAGIHLRKLNALVGAYKGFSPPKLSKGERFTFGAWNTDGSAIIASSNEGTIYIWDVSNETILYTFSAHKSPVQRLTWSSTFDLIASGDDTGRILVWNPYTGEIVTELAGHTGAIHDLDWRVDGQQLASAASDNTLRTWEWPSGEMKIIVSDVSVWSIAYSPDGTQLAFGGELSDPQKITPDVVTILTTAATPTLNTPTSTAP